MSFIQKLTSTKVALLICLLVTLITFGQTLCMYFWIDDNAVIYKLQHLDQNIGYWGEGIVGSGPYRHIIDQFIPFYPLFKTNPTPYYAVGIILYFITSVSIFFFIKYITKNNLLAFASALIFSSGYIGSDSIYGITNSWQTLRGIVMALGTFALYYKYFKCKELRWYVFSVVLFFASLDTVYIRAHGLIFALFTFDILYYPVKFKVSSVAQLILRFIPFAFIHYYIYLTSLAYAKGFGILNLLIQVFEEGKYYLLTMPVQDLGNLFVPDVFSKKLDIFFREYIFLHSEISSFALIFGTLFTLATAFTILKNYKKQKEVTILFIFSTVWVIANFIIFYLRETNHTLWTTHRYFTYSFVGLAIYWTSGLSLIFKKRKNIFLAAIGIIVIAYTSLSVTHQKEFNEKRSFPARNFFGTFDSYLPNIPKDSVLYFSIANNNKIKHEFGSFFGGMFSEGSNLAIYTDEIDYMNEFTFTYKFDDVISSLKEGKTPLDKIYTFYYGENGLINTTESSRKLLSQRETVVINPDQFSSTTTSIVSGSTFYTSSSISPNSNEWIGINPLITVSTANIASTVPSSFEFLMSVQPKNIQLPYKSREEDINISTQEKRDIFEYLSSLRNFREVTKINSASFWKDQEPKFAIDGRTDTAWRGHRGFWDDIDRGITKNIEFLSVDLGSQKVISQVMWVSAQRPLVPTHYKILTSLNGITWQEVLNVSDEQTLPEGTVITNSFDPTLARHVKMEVFKTYGNDGPELKEFEVVESKFANLDRKKIEELMHSPFSRIETTTELNLASEYVIKNANIYLYWKSDDEDHQDLTKYIEVPIIADGRMRNYTIPLPSSGLSWGSFTFGFNFPVDVQIKDSRIFYNSIIQNTN